MAFSEFMFGDKKRRDTVSEYGIEDAKRDLLSLFDDENNNDGEAHLRLFAFIEQQAAEIEAYKPAGATIKRLMHENDALRAEIERLRGEMASERNRAYGLGMDKIRYGMSIEWVPASDRDHYKAMAEWLAGILGGEGIQRIYRTEDWLQAASEAVKP